ncbi:luciferase-type oxidoreductase, BA3436 family [Streptomyces sp. DvalAA-14]|uniref:TIGR03619 family F420-dependent LLM class oxidoreductase n=1 Tax=unclassified Streptomyces TaxID=2593676 RepID=UPI00081BC1BA|nr:MULTISPECIES: TIGR03619 family F420-dependent LLM class oxidoreductase [unclassified Streptomyces]MYS20712.1 TIGR03619 family F420-dependent LLM class oxidoreductase [Streptomyces sp. SID4948]SCD75286.1 luciferase-type oxidoreductase, BA3436 family [Streptomyces sp. DvalAA-14]
MRLHAYIPSETPGQDAAEAAAVAVHAERLGYHGVWLPDHPMPYYEYRDFYGGVWEPMVMLANIAALTTRIRLGTGVLVAAMRNPVIVAKQAATIDRLSHGRLDLGVGVGIVPREFANLGADFHTRGARTDEFITLFRHLFDHGRGPFEGTFHPLGDEAVFAPKPAQDQVPIWIGGRTEAAWKRAARTGDGWLCAMTGADDFARNVVRMRELTDRTVLAGSRIQFTAAEASLERAVAEVETWKAAGADDLIVWFGAPDGYAERMTMFAEALAKVQGS